jgi:hypothetical protein
VRRSLEAGVTAISPTVPRRLAQEIKKSGPHINGNAPPRLDQRILRPPLCAREARADSQFDSRADELRRSTADIDGMMVLRKRELSSLADCGG